MWGYGPHGMFDYGGWGSGWMMLFGGIFWFIFLVLAVAAVVWFVRGPRFFDHHPSGFERRSVGLDVLEERYARGEIGRDEYLEKRRDILGGAETSGKG